MTRAKWVLRRWAWSAVGLALLLNAGCLLAVAGVGAAGAAGYVYYNGKLSRDFPNHLADTAAAVRASLADLQLPLEKETTDTGTVNLQSRTGKGDVIRISLDLASNPLPVDGVTTRVSIRVGLTGDDEVSSRILEQIGTHLTRQVPVPQPQPTGAPPTIGAPRPLESPPPPLAKTAGQR